MTQTLTQYHVGFVAEVTLPIDASSAESAEQTIRTWLAGHSNKIDTDGGGEAEVLVRFPAAVSVVAENPTPAA